jgi:hypothetical protein
MSSSHCSSTKLLVDVAAADDLGDHVAQLVVVRRDEAAVAHVDQLPPMVPQP